MQSGVLDHIDRAAVSLDRFYADRRRLVEASGSAGLYGHVTPAQEDIR